MKEAWVKTELYLGRDIPGGHEVSENEFKSFLDHVITKYFPQGLTLLNAYGQMQHANHRIERQPTYVIQLVHANNAEREKAVEDIINEFRGRFNGAQVMRLESSVAVEFYSN